MPGPYVPLSQVRLSPQDQEGVSRTSIRPDYLADETARARFVREVRAGTRDIGDAPWPRVNGRAIGDPFDYVLGFVLGILFPCQVCCCGRRATHRYAVSASIAVCALLVLVLTNAARMATSRAWLGALLFTAAAACFVVAIMQGQYHIHALTAAERWREQAREMARPTPQ